MLLQLISKPAFNIIKIRSNGIIFKRTVKKCCHSSCLLQSSTFQARFLRNYISTDTSLEEGMFVLKLNSFNYKVIK